MKRLKQNKLSTINKNGNKRYGYFEKKYELNTSKKQKNYGNRNGKKSQCHGF